LEPKRNPLRDDGEYFIKGGGGVLELGERVRERCKRVVKKYKELKVNNEQF